MKHISVLVKPASSMCNLRCAYCFYFNVSSLREVESHGKMKKETTIKMIENIYHDLDDGDQLTLAFQGGEPTLAGLAYYEELVALIAQQNKQVQVTYAIQTNGTTITEKWCRFFKEHQFLVGLSIDGPQIFHDMTRLNTKKTGTYLRIMKTKALFDQYGIEYNILCVLTNQLAQAPEQVYDFIKTEKISFIQFIPCLDDLEPKGGHEYALSPENFSQFYQGMLARWLADLAKGQYISIKLFDDIFNLFVRKQVTACGILGNCQIQYVIEADGSVYPCDFYVLDEYRLGYIQEKTLKELFEQDLSQKFLCEKAVSPTFCDNCPFKKMCGGGCKRMKDAMYVNKQNDFCGYQTLLEQYLGKVPDIIHALEKGAVFSP